MPIGRARYAQEPIWDHVVGNIHTLLHVVRNQEEFQKMDTNAERVNAVCRQIALAICNNLMAFNRMIRS